MKTRLLTSDVVKEMWKTRRLGRWKDRAYDKCECKTVAWTGGESYTIYYINENGEISITWTIR